MVPHFLVLAAVAQAASPRVASVAAPRLPDSPFPVSAQPSRIRVFNLTGASFDTRVLALSAVGVVAQRSPELATVDAGEAAAAGPTGRGGSSGGSAWHLSLLPATLDYSQQHDLPALLRAFAGDLAGYVLCESAGGPRGPGSDNGSMHVAIGLAGVLRAVVVTPAVEALAIRAGLRLTLDARNLTLAAAWAAHKAEYSTKILFNQQHANLVHTTDYAIYSKAFALFDATLTMPLSRAALERLDPISMVLGWATEVDFVTSVSRFGHQVLCSDLTTNLPVYSNFALAPKKPPRTKAEARCTAAEGDMRHTATFMFTDGDSITWDLGNFASPAFDWWGSAKRGAVPIAWTFQPALQELHPTFLRWVLANASANDTLIVGPSGAGYAYLDQYPDAASRARFGAWTSANVERTGLVNMVNQIQVQTFEAAVEAEQLALPRPPEAFFVDEHEELSIRGSAWRLPDARGAPSDTVVTSRRHCLSKTFGDVTPESLAQLLNGAPARPDSPDGYSVVGVECWGYGVSDVAGVVANLDPARVRVVGVEEYVACLKERALPKSALPEVEAFV